MTVEVRRVDPDDPRALSVLTALSAEYESRYGGQDEMATTSPSDFEPPDGAFVVLVDEAGETIAGGGYRRHTVDTCEIKRMWTAETYRRRGLASTILRALEDAARAAGYRRVILETGPAQPEAHALYVAHDYSTASNLGRYADATAYEKSLADPW